MNIDQVKEFINYLSEKKNFSEMEVEFEGLRIYLKKDISSNSISEKGSIILEKPFLSSSSEFIEIKSPMVGIFYRKPSPESNNFIEIGDTIKKGDKLCIIESMKVFNTLESEYEGTVEKILVEDSQSVEYGQPLFVIKKY